ncbi:unnamed protein product [Ectocarpus sp. 4 AP-2014]
MEGRREHCQIDLLFYTCPAELPSTNLHGLVPKTSKPSWTHFLERKKRGRPPAGTISLSCGSFYLLRRLKHKNNVLSRTKGMSIFRRLKHKNNSSSQQQAVA